MTELPALSVIAAAGQLWTLTPGNPWRAPVWATGSTDLSVAEMAGLPGVVLRVGA